MKWIVIGKSGSGKTSILKRIVYNEVPEEPLSTVGVEFFSYQVPERDVKLNIWDTAGQERYYTMTKSYYRSAVGVVVVYDICERNTFEDLPRWVRDARVEADPNCELILVGNKIDKQDQRKVSREEAEDFAKHHNINNYIEVSAKSGEHCNEIVSKLLEVLNEKIANKVIDLTRAPVSPSAMIPQKSDSCC